MINTLNDKTTGVLVNEFQLCLASISCTKLPPSSLYNHLINRPIPGLDRSDRNDWVRLRELHLRSAAGWRRGVAGAEVIETCIIDFPAGSVQIFHSAVLDINEPFS